MYIRWASAGFKVELLDEQAEARLIKSATFRVEGDYAYGLLAAEAGVHRMVQISPFTRAALARPVRFDVRSPEVERTSR